MAVGYVRLFRSLLDSDVFHDEWHLKLFVWCLLKAEWKPTNFKGQAISPGQFVTGRNTAADELKVSPSKFYRGLQVLVERYKCIALQANNQWTTVTVCNWQAYQSSVDQERTANEQPVTQPADGERTAADTTSGHILRSQEVKNPEEKSAPCRAATSADDQTTNTANGKAAIPPPLQDLIDAWNGLPEGLAPRVTKPNSKAVLKGWERVQRDAEARGVFADVPKLVDTIRGSPFLHAQSWFKFEWLFSKDKDRITWNVCKIIEGNYRDRPNTHQRSATGQAARTGREAQGQGDGESVDDIVARTRPGATERMATSAPG